MTLSIGLILLTISPYKLLYPGHKNNCQKQVDPKFKPKGHYPNGILPKRTMHVL